MRKCCKKKRCIIKSYKLELTYFAILILFPLVVGAFYAIPIPQIIPIEMGDLLAFYAASLGIFASFITYRSEKKKEKKEKESELKPQLIVSVGNVEKQTVQFTLRNIGKTVVKSIDMIDEHISDLILPLEECTFTAAFVKSTDEEKLIEADCYFYLDDEEMKDGYPNEIYFMCDDEENRTWQCEYFLVKNGAHYYYHPSKVHLP